MSDNTTTTVPLATPVSGKNIPFCLTDAETAYLNVKRDVGLDVLNFADESGALVVYYRRRRVWKGEERGATCTELHAADKWSRASELAFKDAKATVLRILRARA